MGEAVDMVNDIELVQLVEEIALARLQVHNVNANYAFNASEDATVLGRRVQEHGSKKAIYFILGADRTASHHEAEFDFDENQLTGVTFIPHWCNSYLAKSNVNNQKCGQFSCCFPHKNT